MPAVDRGACAVLAGRSGMIRAILQVALLAALTWALIAVIAALLRPLLG
jgi:hypothetical protein